MSEATDRKHERIVERLRALSVEVDKRLDPADADLTQLAIGALLAELSVYPGQTIH